MSRGSGSKRVLVSPSNFQVSGRKRGQAALILEPLIVETPSQEKSMTLRELTRTIISIVENTSDCPVVISEAASLKT
jgi:hypothetical protein